MKSEKVSKSVSLSKSSSKKLKVADLAKGKKKEKVPGVTGFTRGMGLFFIGSVGILSALLLFNLIIHFGVSDALEDSIFSQTLGSNVNGKAIQGVTYKPEAATAMYFSFKHSSTSNVSELTEGGDTKVLYVTEGTPAYNTKGITSSYVASFEFSQESLDDTVTKLLKKDGTSKKIDVDNTDASEVTNPGDAYKYLVFKNKNVVYVAKLSTAKDDAAEVDLIESSLTLSQ